MDHTLPSDAPADAAAIPRPQDDGCVSAERTARHIRMLEDVAEIAVEMTLQVQTQARAANWVDEKDAYMLDIFTRSLRRSLALAEKIAEDARKRAAGEAAEPAHPDAPRNRPAPSDDKTAERQAARELAGPSDAEYPLDDLRVRLDEPEIEDELGNRPIRETVAAICKDLRITRDLSDFPEAATAHADPGEADARQTGEAAARAPPAAAGGPLSPRLPQSPRIAAGRDPP